jgi:nicotinate-nucleotide pyrophosphorylase (carboxylating)
VKDLLKYAAENKTSLTRIMLDNMVVPLGNGDLDVSMLKDAVRLINGRFETEVCKLNFAKLTFSHMM